MQNPTTTETTADKTLQPGVDTRYVHSVSHIKNGKYFVFQLQMKRRLSGLSALLCQNESISLSIVQAMLQWKQKRLECILTQMQKI